MSDQVMNQTNRSKTVYASANSNYRETGRVEADAGLVNVVDKSGAVTATGKALTAGASAQLSSAYTGAGVQATFVEAGADLGGVVGAKVGLSADTELGAGSSGVTVKAIGTGVKVDKTGLEVSILGSGVKLGKWASPFHWLS